MITALGLGLLEVVLCQAPRWRSSPERPDPLPRGRRWNDFTFAKRGSMWVIAGEDPERKGTVEVIDPDDS